MVTHWLSLEQKLGKNKDLAVKLGATNESVKKLVLELMKTSRLENEVDDIVINYEKFKPELQTQLILMMF